MTIEEAKKMFNDLDIGDDIEFINSRKTIIQYIEELETKVKELGKAQHTLMQSRRKWKKRYYKAKGKLKNSIAKQAIRDKIEELNNTKGDLADTIVANAKVDVLIELLGGNEK